MLNEFETKMNERVEAFDREMDNDLNRLKEILFESNDIILSKDENLLEAKHLIEEVITMGYTKFIIETQLVKDINEKREKKMKSEKQIQKLNLEWYVLNHDFNKKEIYNFNIFSGSYLTDLIRMIKDKYYAVKDYDSLKECIKRWANYHFNHKAEYEIWVKGWFDDDNNAKKISVYNQIEPNLDILTKYINDKLNIV